MKPFALFLLWQKQNFKGKSTKIRHFGNGQGNWAKFFIAKTSGNVTRQRNKNWPVAGRRIPEIMRERSHLIATKMVIPKLFNPTEQRERQSHDCSYYMFQWNNYANRSSFTKIGKTWQVKSVKLFVRRQLHAQKWLQACYPSWQSMPRSKGFNFRKHRLIIKSNHALLPHELNFFFSRAKQSHVALRLAHDVHTPG